MRESASDLQRLQARLEDSYARAGEHLAGIHPPKVRLGAGDLVARLDGMQVLVLATMTADGRPLTGPVDAFIYRGRFCFGTSPTSVRARHIARSSWVSATHVRGEGLVVTVHGRAVTMDLDGPDSGFRELLREHYGGDWDDWGGSSPYFAIDPERMFAADMTAHTTD